MFVYSSNFRGSPNGWTEIKRSNFLVGENSTGKSSFSSLVQITRSSNFIRGNSTEGVVESLVEFEDFYSKMSAKKPQSQNSQFSIGMSIINSDKKYSKIMSYIKGKDGIQPRRMTLWDGKTLTKLSFRDGKLLRKICDSSISESTKIALKQITDFHDKPLKDEDELEQFRGDMPPALFWNFVITMDLEPIEGKGYRVNEVEPPKISPTHAFGPIRSNPERIYFNKSREFDLEGRSNILSLPKSLQKEKFKKALNKFGKASGLFQSISVESLEKKLQKKAIIVKFTKGGVDFFADELGFGVSQVLPLVIDMVNSNEDNSTVLIQQPELHLHPKAQAAFGELLYEFSYAGGLFIVETHSDFLIDRFRIKVAEAKRKKVKSHVLFFRALSEKNVIKSIPIGLDGNYISPPNYFRNFFLKESLRKFKAL